MRSERAGKSFWRYRLNHSAFDQAAAQRRRGLLVLAGKIVFAGRAADAIERFERLWGPGSSMSAGNWSIQSSPDSALEQAAFEPPVPSEQTTRDDRLRSLGGEVLGDERCVRRRLRDICRQRASFFLDLDEQPGLNRLHGIAILSDRLPSPARNAILADLHTYLSAILDREWPDMQRRNESRAAGASFQSLWQTV